MPIPKGTICENCGENKATVTWIGNGGTLAITRSYMQHPWCKECVLVAQIEHISKVAKDLPKLEKELKELRAAHVQ